MRSIRIFISSPGDVLEERERVRKVVEQLRRRYAGRLELKPVLWEDLPLQADTSFQRGIDLVLSGAHRIDLAVFILWSRLGTPPGPSTQKPQGGEYRSGTQREFHMMLSARAQSGGERPQILVYTRQDDASFDERLRGHSTEEKQAMLRQKQMVEAFIAEEFQDRDGQTNLRAYHQFDQPSSFSTRVRAHLQELLDEVAAVRPGTPIWDCERLGSPFQGLAAFQYEHAPVFFGREDEILEVRQALRQQARDGRSFVLISGPSGSGKSSLARSGVLPAVVEGEIDQTVSGWRRCVFTPGQLAGAGEPAETGEKLIAGLVKFLVTEECLPGLRAEAGALNDLVTGLRRDPGLTFRLRLKPALAAAAGGSTGQARLIVLVDQLEELFTDSRISPAERAEFDAVLEAFARSGAIWVIATMRSDFYQELQHLTRVLELKRGRGQIDLLPPGPDALRRLIEEPARLAELTYEAREGYTLADRILRDAAAHPELLPLVEDLLRDLFLNRTAQGVMTFACYETLGGVEGSLARRAELAFLKQSPGVQAAFHPMMKALVTIGGKAGEEGVVRRRASFPDLRANPETAALCEALLRERLLTSDEGDGPDAPSVAAISIAHEALLRVWERARSWVEENREFLRVRARLALRLEEGSALHEDDPLLPLALSHLARDPAGFTAGQRDYVRACARAIAVKRRRRAGLGFSLACAVAGIGLWAFLAAHRARDEALKTAALRHQSAQADLAVGRDLLASDRPRDAMAYLVRSAQSEPAEKLPLLLASHELNGWKYLREQRRLHGHLKTVTAVEFSPQGDRILSCSDDQTAVVWDAASGEKLFALPEAGAELTAAHFSADGKRLVTAALDKNACVWDAVKDSTPLWLTGHEGSVQSARFSPDGGRIATASDDNTARLWDSKTGSPLRTLSHGSTVFTAEFSPLGDRLVTASADQTAAIWNTASGERIATCQGHEGYVRNAEFSPDGAMVVTASADTTARLWDAATGKLLYTLSGHRASVSRAHFSPDGTRVITASADHTACLWEAASGKLLWVLSGHEGGLSNARFSPDGLRVATVGADATVRLWDVSSGELIAILVGHQRPATDVAFNPLGNRIVTGSYDSDVLLWPTQAQSLSYVLHQEPSGIAKAESCGDGTSLLFVSGGIVKVFDPGTGQTLKTFHEPAASIKDADFTGVGNRMVSGSGKSIRILGFTGDSPGPLREIACAPVRTLGFSTDGKLIAAAHEDDTARIYRAEDGALVSTFSEHEGHVYSVALSHDSRQAVTASGDSTARIWDATTAASLHVLEHQRPVWDAAFSPDGTRVATACDDSSAYLWDSDTGACRLEMKGRRTGLRRVRFSHDGSRLATASLDGTIQIHETSSGLLLGTLRGHRGPVLSLRFSEHDDALLSASADGTIRRWSTPAYASGPPPAWLPAFLTWLSFRKYNPQGELAEPSSTESERSEQDLASALASERSSYRELTQPFLEPGAEQTIYPGLHITRKTLADRWIQPDSDPLRLRRAYALDPAHPLIQIALARFESSPQRALFLNQYGLRQLNDQQEFLGRAARLLAAQGRSDLARQCVERALAHHPNDRVTLQLREELTETKAP